MTLRGVLLTCFLVYYDLARCSFDLFFVYDDLARCPDDPDRLAMPVGGLPNMDCVYRDNNIPNNVGDMTLAGPIPFQEDVVHSFDWLKIETRMSLDLIRSPFIWLDKFQC